jgi:hypothetical protein
MGQQFARIKHLAATHGNDSVATASLGFCREALKIVLTAVEQKRGCNGLKPQLQQIRASLSAQISCGGTAAQQQRSAAEGGQRVE